MRQRVDSEYIDMYQISPENFWVALEHMGRYAYAAWLVKKRRFNTVLDVACSNGFGCEQLAKSGAQVMGVDSNAKLIDAAKERHKHLGNISYMTLDIDEDGWTKKLDADKFDAIICFEAIEHIKHPQKLLTSLVERLMPNGRLLLSVPAAEYEPLNEEGVPKNPYHRHVFSRLDISAMLTKAGLSVEQVLGQPEMNRLLRKHNTFCSRNPEIEPFTTSSFKVSPESLQYFIQMFAYPEKGSLQDAYSHLYLLKKA